MAEKCGYVMSTRQLNDLWHYEMFLAHALLDLPLRKCSARPADLPDFPAMQQKDFHMLRRHIRSMWVEASFLFSCKKGDYGWGLFAAKDYEQNSSRFAGSKNLVLGWLVKAPSPEKCPTGHRYLRSAAGTEEYPLYLAGPVSLANFDPENRVLFKKCVSGQEPHINKVYINKVRGRKVVEGQEILWSYSLNSNDRQRPNFHPENEWQPDMCCSQTEISAIVPIPQAPEQNDAQIAKKRRVGGQRPLLTAGEVTSHKMCTYCGENLALNLKAGQKPNVKRHLALKHASHLCLEMGSAIDCEDEGVSDMKFIQHLDKVDHIYNSLKSHGYKIVPACKYFELNNTAMLPEEASLEDKEKLFHEFFSEAKSAFYRYQVIYLKGIMIPENYEDLMVMSNNSNYNDVQWENQKPSGSNFSLNAYELTAEEDSEHALNIKGQLAHIVLAWA